MEDWLHFICTFSHHIFDGVLPPKLFTLWGHLRTSVLHYFGRNLPWSEEKSREAAAALYKYSELMEAYNFPDHMFTLNLHICNCQLPIQERTRGAASRCIELIMERFCGDAKKIIGRRAVHGPEKVIAQYYLDEKAIKSLVSRFPEMQIINFLNPVDHRVGVLWDHKDFGPGPKILFLGKGQCLPGPRNPRTGPEYELCLSAVKKYLEINKPVDPTLAPWTEQHIQWAFDQSSKRLLQDKLNGVIVFNKAEVNEEKYSSFKFMNSQSSGRANYWIWQKFEGSRTGQNGVYIGKIKYFIKIPWSDTVGPKVPPLRLAIIEYYPKAKPLRGSNDAFIVDARQHLSRDSHTAVDPFSLGGKLVTAQREDGQLTCMTYSNLTSRD